ncbi:MULTISPECIES: LysM peptidoglycan-binding domain-containing M23 family metallopeptidase [Streptomyces]|uniref:LysM peptidoglycan-binding domain-containing M23 family metallopeptidase n=1 Tax=Streptomyces silvae TaxID=2803812 RepID=A0ABU8ABK2_9ACTN|nr:MULTISPECIES: LysM peptidoglycan-binding domain-containing M23 family metallopeptidase [unclassified Streptomyces]WSS65611.1 LysM peptidoglycan-binding domain-containing M23 family metallopeptidase [Streptomyces sp. NBC_01177]WSS79640.1 LysM peptidoglycan-binding domain-containing M23 family metallopeptidase [Streptomyces sp. NBC_01174]MDX3324419.1 LysM peptidoglycan-binding domain-containing M23 family metallopeptidase [Streptomyces sp. ME02-6979-3A]MDX3427448.1 LysM peptidoglycan-binding d
MPAKGKHRRTKTGPISRGVLAAGTGGAVLALPLIGATGAHAAEQSAPAAAAHSASASAPAAKSAPKTYSVVSGDYLAKIAAEKKVKGGWQKLYQDNRDVVGENPSLILPGMKLTLGAKASGSAEAAPSTSAPSAAKKAAPAEKTAAPAEKTAAPAAETADSGASESTGSGWAAPVENPNVTTQYRASGASWSSGYHTGSDFQAASGTSVRSIGPGTVVSAGWSGSYGNEVVIQHEDGMYSQYAHLSSLEVSAGQTVTGGQQIGLSGTTGNSTGPHLHFEVRTGPSYGSDVDPIAYLRSHGVSI